MRVIIIPSRSHLCRKFSALSSEPNFQLRYSYHAVSTGIPYRLHVIPIPDFGCAFAFSSCLLIERILYLPTPYTYKIIKYNARSSPLTRPADRQAKNHFFIGKNMAVRSHRQEKGIVRKSRSNAVQVTRRYEDMQF